MHPRIQEVLAFLDEQRAALWHTVDNIPPELHDRQPESGWSMAGVVEHLGLTEAGLAQRVMDAVADRRASGLVRDGSTGAVMPTLDVAMFLDRNRRVVARDALHPTGLDMATARKRLDDVRRDFRAAIVSYDGLALDAVGFPHPRLGDLNVYQWVLFIGAHEGKHAAQIREIAGTFAGQSCDGGAAGPPARTRTVR